MRDNWVIDTRVTTTAEKIFGIMTSFLGCNGSEDTLEQISARCRPAALDCINAAIGIVNRVNRGFCGEDISPEAVTAFETSITCIGSVAYGLLPLKAAEMAAIRFEMNVASTLGRLFETSYRMYCKAIPAQTHAITEVC